jgi:hypothetical protein
MILSIIKKPVCLLAFQVVVLNVIKTMEGRFVKTIPYSARPAKKFL